MNSELHELAAEVRGFLEGRWVEWRAARYRTTPEVVSESMCRMSAATLVDILNHHGDGWVVAGGAGEDGAEPGECDRRQFPGGMQAADGRWHGHYWALNKATKQIVDITADQFGHETVIVTVADDERYRPNYLAKALKDHLSHVKVTKSAWLEEWSDRLTQPAP